MKLRLVKATHRTYTEYYKALDQADKKVGDTYKADNSWYNYYEGSDFTVTAGPFDTKEQALADLQENYDLDKEEL